MDIKKILLITGSLFLCAALGGFATSRMRGRPASAKAAHKAEPEPTTSLALEEFIVNLADTDISHYLKTGIVLEVKGGHKDVDEVGSKMAKIRDSIITSISRKRFDELLTPR